MSETKFTQEPWEVRFDEETHEYSIWVEKDPDRRFEIATEVGGECYWDGSKYDLSEVRANAYLMAASKDMYRALGNCLSLLRALSSPTDEVAQTAIIESQRVLLKARGESTDERG